jgi:hypothetical protein
VPLVSQVFLVQLAQWDRLEREVLLVLKAQLPKQEREANKVPLDCQAIKGH